MKAAVVHTFDQPLRVEEVPMPTAGHGQVVGGASLKAWTLWMLPRSPAQPSPPTRR